MLYYRFKLVIRRLTKDYLFTGINIFGLAIAIALIHFLTIYIYNELHVDHFHENSEQIYRVVHDNGSTFSPPFGQYIKDNLDGIESFIRTFEIEAVLKHDNKMVRTDRCLFVDSNFFNMFSFPFIQGNPANALKAKDNVVISESFAKQMFGMENPIGKKIRYNNRLEYYVSGIYKDFNQSTHFNKLEAIFPFHAMVDVWGNKNYLKQYSMRFFMPGLYVKTRKGIDLKGKGKELVEKAKPWYWLFQNGRNQNITFQPLKEVYLNPVDYAYPMGARSGNGQLVNIMMLIVIGISLIAAINYVNISVSKSINQSNEIGIKKISGAFNRDIIFQSIAETTILFMAAALLAFALLFAALTKFNQLVGYEFTCSQIMQANMFYKFFGAILFFSLSISMIPALFLTRLKPIATLSKPGNTFKIKGFQKVLTVSQFSISIVLIMMMVMILKQNRYLRNFDVGFDKKHTLYVNLNSDMQDSKTSFREELLKIPGVENASFCGGGMPGIGIWNSLFEYNGESKRFFHIKVDEHYFATMGITLKDPAIPASNNC